MSALQNKIDFALVIAVSNANPNGDPLNGNRPRETYEGFGEISDVCLKRKIRNRLMDMGECVFVQSDDRCTDGFRSLKERADAVKELKTKDRDEYARVACETWLDVRSFGQVFAFKSGSKDDGVSVGVRGPVKAKVSRCCRIRLSKPEKYACAASPSRPSSSFGVSQASTLARAAASCEERPLSRSTGTLIGWSRVARSRTQRAL